MFCSAEILMGGAKGPPDKVSLSSWQVDDGTWHIEFNLLSLNFVFDGPERMTLLLLPFSLPQNSKLHNATLPNHLQSNLCWFVFSMYFQVPILWQSYFCSFLSLKLLSCSWLFNWAIACMEFSRSRYKHEANEVRVRLVWNIRI